MISEKPNTEYADSNHFMCISAIFFLFLLCWLVETLHYLVQVILFRPIPVDARSKAWVCGLTLAGIAGSNSVGGMDVYLFRMSCVVRYSSLRRANHSSDGVLPGVMCLSVIS
jgi:hypothetical protein